MGEDARQADVMAASVVPWQVRRDTRLAKNQVVAAAMIGGTVAAVTAEPHMDECDGSNVLRITLSDGRAFVITGGYGGYTGHSCDEYLELLAVEEVMPDA